MKELSEMEKHYLYDELTAYCHSDHYPFHMPGHKRHLGMLADPFTFDITEIEGFDNLHHAEGILLEAQQRAAAFYGSSETHFLVNGSTSGILSAIGACVPQGKILMSRNCHKAAYHAVYLNRLEAVYLYPQTEGTVYFCPEAEENVSLCPGAVQTAGSRPEGKQEAFRHAEKSEYTGNGCGGAVSPEAVRAALSRDPDIRAVFITSPTYEGVISDVEQIAEAAHEHGIPLIVDEAHGAHFGMHPIFPESALKLGADVVIQSLHKTLPSLTQTALLHVNGSLADRKKIRRMLGVYQSSSPSYVLMASMDQCIRILEEQGKTLFESFAENLKFFYDETENLSVLKIRKTDDPSKILISSGSSGLSGREISCILREKYHLEMEMEAVSYALALTSVGDTREGFVRLARALQEMDGKLAEDLKNAKAGQREKKEMEADPHFSHCAGERWERISEEKYPDPAGISEKNIGGNPPEMTIWEAENAPQERVLLTESAGCISGEFIYMYPPGIPLVVPGEQIEEKVLHRLLENRKMGYSLQGMEDYSMKYLRVVKEQ